MTKRTRKINRSSAKRKLEYSQAKQNFAATQNLLPSVGKIIERSVERCGLPLDGFIKHLTQTALSRLCVWSENDLKRLLIAAERLGLDPLNNEIYAIQGGGDPLSPVLLVVSVNGWSRILNANPAFDGMHFLESIETLDSIPQWIECTIHRKDRSVPTTVREYLCEVRGTHSAWLSHPRRMLRHKAMVQCARICFGLVGIYDPDEAMRIQESRSSMGQTNSLNNIGADAFSANHSIHTRKRAHATPSSQAALKTTIRAMHKKSE